MTDLAALSNETVWQQFKLDHPADGLIDVTGFPVELAVVELGSSPTEADWFTAAWEPAADSAGYYLAHLEVGPGAGTVELVAGTTYQPWLRLTLATETPVVRGVDEITVY